MFSFIIVFHQFWRAGRVALRDPEFQSLAAIVVTLLVAGTIFYHSVEDWNWLDSLYFCVITLATVGYGDFSPHTDAGKLFTMLYIFMGIGLLVAVFTRLADALTTARKESSIAKKWTQKKEDG
ncbi:MAG: potassium channel family protein [Caldilineaceae bacterium]